MEDYSIKLESQVERLTEALTKSRNMIVAVNTWAKEKGYAEIARLTRIQMDRDAAALSGQGEEK
jgi:hypothetical protein